MGKQGNPAWTKGVSGNPDGRPRVVAEFQAKARKAVDALVIEAWEAEVRGMGDNWVRCSELLAAYAYGKPKDSLEVSGDPDSPLMTGLAPDMLADFGLFRMWLAEQRKTESLPDAQTVK